MELEIINEQLTDIEKQEIDKEIENIINKHRGNSFEINRLVFESVNSLETSNSYARELESQGKVKRFFGMVSGKNRDLQSKIDRNLYKSQYASQQILQKLAEQNLMSFELITAVNNKLNSSIIEVENEINNIYGTLVTFFKQTKSDLIQLESRVERLEKNVNLLNWVNTIEYQMWNGVEYSELDDVEKIVCLAKDFYEITKGEWNTSDLLLLKSAIAEIGLSPKEKIGYDKFIKYLSANEVVYNKLLSEDIRLLDNEDYNYTSILNGISKDTLLKSDESYIVESVIDALNDNNVEVSDEDIRFSLVGKYLKYYNKIDFKGEVSIFDFITELILNVSIFEKLTAIDFRNESFEVVKRYAERNNPDAQSQLGYMYDCGIEVEQDYKEAVKWYRKAAAQGNARAQSNLGVCYENGTGVEQDYREAVKWYRKAVEQDYEVAQCNLGVCFECRRGVEQDYREAVKWFRKAAEQGYVRAQNNLGNMYYNGKGVEQDYREAVKWFRKAAEQGYAWGQNNLGVCYNHGKGVEQDYREAVKWYRKAAEQGHAIGESSLGYMHACGKGVEQDYKEAMKWYRKAAKQGDSTAQYNIGINYYYGNGVEVNKDESKKFMKLSAASGDEDAKKFLEEHF